MKERVGTVKAKQMIWEGKVLTAKEALDAGLIDYIAPEGTVFAMADQVVGKMLASPISSMITTKNSTCTKYATARKYLSIRG